MNRSEQKSLLQYTTIVIIVICFIVAFIYQNIEYMRLKMQYNGILTQYHEIIEEHDRYAYQLYRALSMENLEAFAKDNGMMPLTRENLIVIENRKAGR